MITIGSDPDESVQLPPNQLARPRNWVEEILFGDDEDNQDQERLLTEEEEKNVMQNIDQYLYDSGKTTQLKNLFNVLGSSMIIKYL